jgi:hypothetical protein
LFAQTWFLHCYLQQLQALPSAFVGLLLELKLCLEAAEEHFLVIANPNFERGRVEKNELLRERGALEIAHGEAVRQPDYSEVVRESIET